jgi:hypothetical protein
MKEQKPQYPASLFWTGVALSILHSILWLVIATILMLLGAKTPWLGWAGLALLVLVVAVAIIKQLIYRHTLLHASPDMEDWQAATLSPEWKDNVLAMVQRAMNDTEADAYMEEEDGTNAEDDEDEEDSSDISAQNEENDR